MPTDSSGLEHWSFPGLSSWTSSYTHSLGELIQAHSFEYYWEPDDSQMSITSPHSPINAYISVCWNLTWMLSRHLKLKMFKTKLLVPFSPSSNFLLHPMSSPFQIMAILFFQELWSKTLKSVWTPFSLTHPMSNPSANPVGPTFKVFPGSSHSSPSPLPACQCKSPCSFV